jgi:DNA polymerase-1
MPRLNERHREKDVFRAEEGRTMIFGDWSQMELRVGAHFARCQTMIDAFARGDDIHGQTALLVHGVINAETRNGDVGGKRCNFAIVYGTGVPGFVKTTGLPRETCARILAKLKRAYPEFPKLYNEAEMIAWQRGYIKYFTGRRRRFPDKGDCYKAMNHLVQGTVAEMARQAMIDLDAWLTKDYGLGTVYLPLQVHDEMILDAPTELVREIVPKMKAMMESWEYLGKEKFRGQIIADMAIGTSWGGKEKWLGPQ